MAAELLQRWLPVAQGKQSCPLLPVCSLRCQTHSGAVPFSLTPTHSVTAFLSLLAANPQICPSLLMPSDADATPRMPSDAASGIGLSHGPSKSTNQTHLRQWQTPQSYTRHQSRRSDHLGET